MDYKFFLNGIISIISNPVKAWETIDSENRPPKILRNSFLLPLIILVTVSAFAGSLIFVYVTSFIFREVTYPLDLGRDFNTSFRLTVYSITPFLLCQIISRLFESLLFINIIGLFGLYIFWTGAEKMLNPPQYKKMPMLIAVSLIIAGIYITCDLVLSMMVERIYFAFFA
jgi:magnesium-transporting ATPase (P-type)